MQDTFFLSNPSELSIDDVELLGRVKRMHARAWKSRWSPLLAKKSLLRTHTTGVSARHINKFASEPESAYPIKLFSVGKIFRNEAIDYKHLAELYQLDGIVIGNGLNMANLIHTLKEFYSRLGIDVFLKPSYFPFVEPGLEVLYRDKKRNDTIELCGAGMIRGEITKAMGTDKTVLAWGMGLDRQLFNYVNMETLTELYKNNVGWLRQCNEVSIPG
jgi:phenylalanyl-tRNA synthetase alpha chain